MAGRLFKRGASLSFIRVQEVPATRARGLYFPEGTVRDTTTVTDLRITFQIEKNLERSSNTTEVMVYNLKEATRALLQNKPLVIRLDLGYDGFLERVFQGDMIWAASRHEGTEWESRILVGDGDRSIKHSRVNRSYRGGVTIGDALHETATTMGLTLPPLDSSLLQTQMVSGLVLQGRAAVEMSRLLAPFGLGWSIQDGRLQILDDKAPRNNDQILINQDTGLVGSPEYGAPERKGARPVLTLKTLLNPKIVPGGKIRVDSRVIDGVFRVERVAHEGDTHGGDWFSTIEAKPL